MAGVEVTLHPKARQDIEEIWVYTLKTWGLEQAESYFGAITSQFDLLAQNPELGRACDYIRKDYRRLEVGKHVIFYKISKKLVLIVRILHQRMDVAEHL